MSPSRRQPPWPHLSNLAAALPRRPGAVPPAPSAVSPESTDPAGNEEPDASPTIGAEAGVPPDRPAPRLDPAALAAAGFSAGDIAVSGGEPAAPAAGALPAPVAVVDLGPPLSDVEDALARLVGFGEVVLSWVAEDGYPMNVSVPLDVNPREGLVRFGTPAGLAIPADSEVAITGTHIRPLPHGGFDERSHVTVWGVPTARPRGRFVLRPERAWIWDETEIPLPAAYERSLPKARRYFEDLSRERGYRVRPRMDLRLLLFRATRAPFLTATLVPVLLGLVVAAQSGYFDLTIALLTVAAACMVHLGLNVANDVFDTLAGADDANASPTQFSGGSRVLQNALVSIGQMSALAAACYLVAGVIGLGLFAMRGSSSLAALVVAGLAISLCHTMPPFKLVYRGLGEVATAIGFGPVMLLGAYVVQTRGSISTAALLASVPVGLLVAMILFVNEIPDRFGDVKAGKRTLPVRLGKRLVILGFDVSVAAAFLAIGAGVVVGLLPIPTLLALLAVPQAREIHAGLVRFYDSPYALMPTMALNIRLHLTVGVMLWLGYIAAIADQQLLHRRPFLW